MKNCVPFELINLISLDSIITIIFVLISFLFHQIAIGDARQYWFVLTLNTLFWYEEKDEKKLISNMKLDGLQLCDINQSFQPRKHIIALFHPDGHNVYEDHKQLRLSSESIDEIKSWKQSFSQAFSHEPSNVSYIKQFDFT